MNEFEQTVSESKDDPEGYIGNPVNAFLLVKKLNREIAEFADILYSFSPVEGNKFNYKKRVFTR